ncbi:GNAT family N-acetyltransferase [Bacillus suaedae]|uniref:GNAT family N-acetyltransferase n=1 Tax=Halalkalibacter suaedae TaxID=2822140 RepID=A0A940WW55_9BACI|nr:GNAT family protein [Bacillus suaedae]MBP3951692.1 GNAT family N-acetyltransferase [Bacillus suaedae]
MFVYKIDREISLKLVELNDAEQLFELTDQSREHLREWLPWLDTNTKVEDTLNFIKASMKNYAEHCGINTVILYKGKIVGVAGYNEIDWINKIAYIGYWLGKEYEGNGIMTRVSKALTNYAFNELNLNRVEITAAVENMKSRAIPERLGFINEGCKRQAEWLYDHYVDHVIYAMVAADWPS